MRHRLILTPSFLRTLKRFTKRQEEVENGIRQTLAMLEADVFDPRLRTHKLKGNLAGLRACSAGYDLRIIFDLVDVNGEPVIRLLSVGTHDEVY